MFAVAVPTRLLAFACAVGLLCVTRAPAEEKGRARHVVLIVWDGMRPDFVTEVNTPILWKMAQEGVFFRNHHSVYPSATNVNGTAMATGVFPGRNGLIANREFRPAIDAHGTIDTAVSQTIRTGDETSGGRYLAFPTIPELLQKAGRRTAVAGTKWIALLFDRAGGGANGQIVVDGKSPVERTERALLESLGRYPGKNFPNEGQDHWTTSALTEVFWKNGVPDFSLLWLSEPDFTEHEIALGSPEALKAARHSDEMLGRVLAALEARGVRGESDVLVVSDHGFSTIEREHDLPAMLREAGFDAGKRFEGDPKPGRIVVAGNAGTTLFYVIGRDRDVTRRLVEWLQQSEFAGVIFTREKLDGTFATSEMHLDKPDGADVIMSFRWNDQPNRFGTRGMLMADWNRAAGKGTHASLSRFDLHNTLIATGPDFRRGRQSEIPSSNLDVAPTILRILGVETAPLDGRVLQEAMTWGEYKPDVKTETVEATRTFGRGKWRQYLKISSVGTHRYVDEGNGSFEPSTTR